MWVNTVKLSPSQRQCPHFIAFPHIMQSFWLTHYQQNRNVHGRVQLALSWMHNQSCLLPKLPSQWATFSSALSLSFHGHRLAPTCPLWSWDQTHPRPHNTPPSVLPQKSKCGQSNTSSWFFFSTSSQKMLCNVQDCSRETWWGVLVTIVSRHHERRNSLLQCYWWCMHHKWIYWV